MCTCQYTEALYQHSTRHDAAGKGPLTGYATTFCFRFPRPLYDYELHWSCRLAAGLGGGVNEGILHLTMTSM